MILYTPEFKVNVCGQMFLMEKKVCGRNSFLAKHASRDRHAMIPITLSRTANVAGRSRKWRSEKGGVFQVRLSPRQLRVWRRHRFHFGSEDLQELRRWKQVRTRWCRLNCRPNLRLPLASQKQRGLPPREKEERVLLPRNTDVEYVRWQNKALSHGRMGTSRLDAL